MRQLILGIVIGLMPMSASAATVSNTYFVDREISFTDSSRGSTYSVSPRFNIIGLDGFDPSLGTLTSVTVDYQIAFLLSLSASDDPGIFGSAEVEADARGQVRLRAGATSLGTLLGNVSHTMSVECGDSLFGTRCNDNAISDSIQVSSTGSMAFAPSAFLAEFGAAPQIRVDSTLSVRLQDGEEATGFLDLMPSSGARFNVTVRYDYEATPLSPVPLPAAGWALLVALGLLLGLRARRRAT